MLCIDTEHFSIMTTDSAHKEHIDNVAKHLERHSNPRLQMMVIVSLTGATGLLSSAVLLRLGLTNMGARYPASVLIAYAAFLALLWLWLRMMPDDNSNLTLTPEPSQSIPMTMPPMNQADPVGVLGGVQGLPVQAAESRFTASRYVARIFNFIGDILRSIIEGFFRGLASAAESKESGKLLIPLIVLLLFIGMGLASIYVIATAPTFLAELLVDGTLSYTLYKQLAPTKEPNWLRVAVTHSRWPLLLTTVFVSVMGWALGVAAPGAHTLGEALAYTEPPLITNITP